MRTIDGDALEELFREVIGGIAKRPEMNGNLEHMVRASAMVIEMIQNAPTIEPERKKGRWIKYNWTRNGTPTELCSVCGMWSLGRCEKFCTNCGAEMGDTECQST